METLSIIPDATTHELPGLTTSVSKGMGTITAIGGIPLATQKGLAGVAVVVTLDDGTTVVGETTLELFKSAASALAARYDQ